MCSISSLEKIVYHRGRCTLFARGYRDLACFARRGARARGRAPSAGLYTHRAASKAATSLRKRPGFSCSLSRRSVSPFLPLPLSFSAPYPAARSSVPRRVAAARIIGFSQMRVRGWWRTREVGGRRVGDGISSAVNGEERVKKNAARRSEESSNAAISAREPDKMTMITKCSLPRRWRRTGRGMRHDTWRRFKNNITCTQGSIF